MAIEFDYQNQKLLVNDIEVLDLNGVVAENVPINPYNTITATNLQTALEQLADQVFRGSTTPTGPNIEVGDFWYEDSTGILYIYREISTNVFNWVPISTGTGDSDTLDGGAY